MMGLFEHWPYVNFHDLNLDWIIKEIPKVFASRDEAQASAEASAESAAASQLSAEASQASADASQLSAEASQQSAEASQDSAEDALQTVLDTRNQINLLQSRVDNIIPSGTQTEGNTELIDIRVAFNGKTYESAGDAVRGQAEYLNDEIDKHEERLAKIFTIVRSDNLFDNDIDQNGFINITTGLDSASQDYKRSSKYYEIYDDTANNIYIRLNPATATFVILFYDENKTYLNEYNSANNVAFTSISRPTGSKYFRVYVRADYESAAYVGTVNHENIIPYGYDYELKDDSIDLIKIDNSNLNQINMVNGILPSTYLQKTTGSMFANDSYRTSELIPVTSGNDYLVGLFNENNAPTIELHAITVCFYTQAGGSLPSYSVYSSDYTHENCNWKNGLVRFTAPETAVNMRIGANDNANHFKWYAVEYGSSELYTEANTFNKNAVDTNLDLQGTHVACFGDSVIGNYEDTTSVSFNISKMTGATVYNFGFGGCRMSKHAAGWDNCSMYNLADDINSGSFTDLLNAINTGWSGMPGYFRDHAAWLANCDFNNIDYIVISYGTNDYREPTSVLDNPDNIYDTNTVCGALRYSIKQIESAYPGIQIIVTCPIFRTFFQSGTTTPEEYSNTKDWGSGTLIDYAEAYKNACDDMNVPFLDLYHNTSFNEFTRLHFYPADEGTHPNAAGRERIAKLISGKIKEV